MAELADLLKDIRQLLMTLSDKFQKLSDRISDTEKPEDEVEAVTRDFSDDMPESFDNLDDTQSLEPPPFDGDLDSLEEETKAFEPEQETDPDEPKTSEMEAVKDDPGNEEEEKELVPPPSEKGAMPLLQKLVRLQEIVKKKGLEVSSKDFAFIPKSTEVYNSLAEGDRVGPKGGRIILDCINFLDTIQYKYPGEYYNPLREAVSAMIRSLSEFLSREVGYKVFPIAEKSRSDIETTVFDYASAAQERLTNSPATAGTVIAIRRRGAILDKDVVRKAQLLIGSGDETEISKVLDAGLDAVSSLKASSERAADMKLKAMSSIIEWREKLYGTSEDHALTVARYALNLLHTLEHPVGVKPDELFPGGQMGRLKKVNGRFTSIMRAGGLSEILVSVGGMFDESYDPSKYERKKVSSDKPAGTIVGVLRKGFLDKNGIPVQKAVIAVSGS